MQVHRLVDLTSAELDRVCDRNPVSDSGVLAVCREVFDQVRLRGDEAVREFTRRFDGVDPPGFRVGAEEFETARRKVTGQVVLHLERAADNIRRFHASQAWLPAAVETESGIVCWREARPISPVGFYIPGGNAVLPSSVLMLGVPARLAGCRDTLLCVPPRKDGSVSPEVLVAAEIAGVGEVLRIGGAQAIAAMALGTSSVRKVNKILGPGNRFVQTAKLLATFEGVAVDMIAGPSEVIVIADDSAAPAFVAADLIAQAEHGADSRAILACPSGTLIEAVTAALEEQLDRLPRSDFARQSLEGSFALLTPTLAEAFEFSNRYAPEHLILHVDSPRRWLARVEAAGSVFLGPWSPEVAGDYASGTNHTLPTSGLARSYSGVSLDSFVKKITFQELTREGLDRLAPTLQALASLEGLEGHRRAVAVRFAGTTP
jgi:histidinol dehydrogenase